MNQRPGGDRRGRELRLDDSLGLRQRRERVGGEGDSRRVSRRLCAVVSAQAETLFFRRRALDNSRSDIAGWSPSTSQHRSARKRRSFRHAMGASAC